jgi:hypothetical protein
MEEGWWSAGDSTFMFYDKKTSGPNDLNFTRLMEAWGDYSPADPKYGNTRLSGGCLVKW